MKMKNTQTIKPIGVIHTPFKDNDRIPIQGGLAQKIKGQIEVFPEYALGLKDVEGFSHIILLYVFHKSKDYNLLAKPFLDDQLRGVFAIRTPHRPNPIGLTIVKLEWLEGNILHVSGMDMIDGTPLLDIKPYVPEFDAKENVEIGWLKDKRERMHHTFNKLT
ncbi:MAG: tRNA (N6-threonylcarbamoyladenosine(37)-N6)-methyltransferase TrmO [Candidatus Altiarchaeota archaeon]